MSALSYFTILTLLGLAQSQSPDLVFDRRGPGVLVNSRTGPLGQFTGGKVSWRLNGDISTWGDGAGLEYVPVVKDATAVDKVVEASKTWGAEVTHLMAFDAATGAGGASSMTSKESIELWNKLRENLDPKYKLGAPLMLKYTAGEFGSSGTSDSMVWYDWVFDQGAVKFDFIPIEFVGNNIEDLVSAAWISSFAADEYHPVWVTKLTCQTPAGAKCSEAEATKFMQEVQDWIADKETANWVERYVWDGADPELAKSGDGSGLLGEDGSLNALGKKYVGV